MILLLILAVSVIAGIISGIVQIKVEQRVYREIDINDLDVDFIEVSNNLVLTNQLSDSELKDLLYNTKKLFTDF